MGFYAVHCARLYHKFPSEFFDLSPFDRALAIAGVMPLLEAEARERDEMEKLRLERERKTKGGG